MLGTTLKNLFATATWQMGSVYPCFVGAVMLLTDKINSRIAFFMLRSQRCRFTDSN